MPAAAVARATRIVPASAADIFELLAAPTQHSVIDGSGMVLGVQPGTPERLSLGAHFGMRMRAGRAGYKIVNEVVEFEEGRRIGWRHFGHHIWRYILEPVADGSTRVTEEFDSTTARRPFLVRLVGFTLLRNQRSIERTLDRLVEWAKARPAAQ